MTPLLSLPLDAAKLAVRVSLAPTRWALRHVPGLGADSAPEQAVESAATQVEVHVEPTPLEGEPLTALADEEPLPPNPGGFYEPNGDGGPVAGTETPVPPAPTELVEGHVEVEEDLAGSFGPADDVGATIAVDEPWDGYAELGAREVVERLRDADPATKAAVALFEGVHKNRQTIIAATRQ